LPFPYDFFAKKAIEVTIGNHEICKPLLKKTCINFGYVGDFGARPGLDCFITRATKWKALFVRIGNFFKALF